MLSFFDREGYELLTTREEISAIVVQVVDPAVARQTCRIVLRQGFTFTAVMHRDKAVALMAGEVAP